MVSVALVTVTLLQLRDVTLTTVNVIAVDRLRLGRDINTASIAVQSHCLGSGCC